MWSSSPPPPPPEPALTDNEKLAGAGVLALLGVGVLAGGRAVYARHLRRIESAAWVTPKHLGRRVRGVVTSVGDPDNFRLFHTPGPGWGWLRRVPETTKELKDRTLHLRVAGVDAPELAHFGNPEQPGAKEALAWMRARLAGKTVHAQLVRKDQYARVVAHVWLPPRFFPARWFRGAPLALEMLRAGHGTVYAQAGAEYGAWGKDKFLAVEAQARKARRGIWAAGAALETPAAYKKRMLAMDPVAVPLAVEQGGKAKGARAKK